MTVRSVLVNNSREDPAMPGIVCSLYLQHQLVYWQDGYCVTLAGPLMKNTLIPN